MAVLACSFVFSFFSISLAQAPSPKQNSEKTYLGTYIELGVDWLKDWISNNQRNWYTEKAINKFLARYLLINKDNISFLKNLPDEHPIFNGKNIDYTAVRIQLIFFYHKECLPHVYQPSREDFSRYIWRAQQSWLCYAQKYSDDSDWVTGKVMSYIMTFYKHYDKKILLINNSEHVNFWGNLSAKYIKAEHSNKIKKGFFTFSYNHSVNNRSETISFGKIGPYIIYVVKTSGIPLYGAAEYYSGWLAPIIPPN